MKKKDYWEQEAITELRQFGQWQAAELNLREEIELLEQMLNTEKNTEKRKQLTIRCEALKERLLPIRIRYTRVERALSALYPRERSVLEALFVHGESPIAVQERLCYEKSMLYNLRRRALDNFVRALYGVI